MSKNPMTYLKAIAAFIVPFAGALSIANNDGHITGNELVNALIGATISAGVVWGIPNSNSNKPGGES